MCVFMCVSVCVCMCVHVVSLPVLLTTYICRFLYNHTFLQLCFFCTQVVAERESWSHRVPFVQCALRVQCSVPTQVDEIECIIPAYEGLALK